jgi:hypothetical protein
LRVGAERNFDIWSKFKQKIVLQFVTIYLQKITKKRLTPLQLYMYNWRRKSLIYKGFFLADFGRKKALENQGLICLSY